MGWPDEKSMTELDLNYSIDAVRVIFNDMFSYHLKFSWGRRIPKIKEHKDHSGNIPHRKYPFSFANSTLVTCVYDRRSEMNHANPQCISILS